MGRTRYLATTRRRSTTSATTRSSGWTRTSSRRWTSSRRSRRKWRRSATRSSPSSTELLEEPLEALTWEVWEALLEVHLVLELVVREVLDQLSRRSTKSNLCTSASSSATAKLNLAVLAMHPINFCRK